MGFTQVRARWLAVGGVPEGAAWAMINSYVGRNQAPATDARPAVVATGGRVDDR